MKESEPETRARDGKAHELLRIGDFARRAGTSLRTLRYYESIGLLRPAVRSKGRFRYYRAVDLHRLRTIQRLQKLGLSLERIGELLSPHPDQERHAEFTEHVGAALRRQDRLLRKRIRQLEDERHKIQEALAKLDDCKDCGFHPSRENNYCDPCAVDGRPLPDDLRAHF